jgi:Holliday junction DNA helicase RuvB
MARGQNNFSGKPYQEISEIFDKNMKKEILTPQKTEYDLETPYERDVRPRKLSDYIGQDKVKDGLKIFIEAAKNRGENLDHILFYGPPGVGKTTLAYVVAHELNVNIKITSGPILEKIGDLAAILTNLEEREVLFIDEIHRINRSVEEMLYPALEEYKLDILIGQGPGAKILRIDLPRFTLIGATTRAGLLTSPLRNRFGLTMRLDYYRDDEIVFILERSAKIMGLRIEKNASVEIAQRTRGTPRIANRILRRIRDYAQVKSRAIVDKKCVLEAFEILDVDDKGFDSMDRKLLDTIIDKFSGGPVGIDSLATSLSEDKETLEDVYEPYLIQKGYIQRTTRGRMATPLAYEYLKKISKREDTLF